MPLILRVVFFVLLSNLCQGQDGALLFHRMQSALGGKEKIAALDSFEECVRAESWDDTGKYHGVVYKRTRWRKPAVLRLDQVGPGDTYVLFFSGNSGWEILPDKGLVDLAGSELEFARGYANGVDIKLWLADDDTNNTLLSSSDHVISISEKGDATHRTDITLNSKTLLPLSESSISLDDPGHPIEIRKREFEHWAMFDGVKFPQRIVNFHHGSKVADIRVLKLEVNGEAKSSELSLRPKNLKPQMSGCGE